MSLMRFATGTEVTIHGKAYRLSDYVGGSGTDIPPAWFARRLDNAEVERFTVAQLRRLYDDGDLRRLYTAADGDAAMREAARRRRIHVPDDLPETDLLRREVRAEFIRRMRARIGLSGAHARIGADASGKPITFMTRALADVSREMQPQLKGLGLRGRNGHPGRPLMEGWPVGPGAGTPEPVFLVCCATFYRWEALAPDPEDKRGLEGNFSARGNRHQLLPEVKEVVIATMRYAIESAKDKRQVGKKTIVTMADIRSRLAEGLTVLKYGRPDLAGRIAVPSAATLHRYWKQFPAYDRAVAKLGPSRARREYRFIRGHEAPDAPYQLVEYDETGTGLVLIDEVHRSCSGRPICAAPSAGRPTPWAVSTSASSRSATSR